MKRSYLIIALALVAALGTIAAMGSGGWNSTSVYSAKRIYTYSSRTDTSATLNTLGAEHLEFAMSVANTDSAYLRTQIQSLVGATWTTVYRDTTRFGDATTTTGKGHGFIVNKPSAATLTPGTARVRALVTVVPYAAADSTGIGSYTLHMIRY